MPHQRDLESDAGGVMIHGWNTNRRWARPHSVIILAPGMGGLKEWTSPEVADSFVEAGFAALTFDYRNFGDSGGEPREEVDHAGQIEDWRSAITFAAVQADLDADRSLGDAGEGATFCSWLLWTDDPKCVVVLVPPIGSSPQEIACMINAGDVNAFFKDLADDRRDRMLGEELRYVTFETDDYTRSWRRRRSTARSRGARRDRIVLADPSDVESLLDA